MSSARLVALAAVACSVLISSCGGGSGSSAPGPTPTPTFRVGGTVAGLSGSGLVLQNNGGDDLVVTNNAFTFATSIANGGNYAVTVKTQPSTPTQTCTLANASGTINGSTVTNVTVTCVTAPLALSSATPASAATNVARTVAPVLTFSAPLNAATVTASSVTLTSVAGASSVMLVTSGNQITVTPAQPLSPLTNYTLNVAASVSGASNEHLTGVATSSFTTRDGAWQAAALIETDTGSARFPEIAFDANGNAIAVWYQSDGMRNNIWANRYTAGTGWGTAALIETDNADDAEFPQIAFDANGNAIAVWHQSDGTRFNIWANRYTAGSGWGTAALIETDNAGAAFSAQIAVDANGNALAVWYQFDGTHDNIWANRYTAGSGWGTAALIESDNADNAINPQIAFDANGNALAVWYQSDGMSIDIWANRYTAGSGWGTAARIETDNAGDATSPQIAFDINGNAFAVWRQSDGTRNNIWANRYTAGTGWGTATLIETDNAGAATSAQIAVDISGNALAVWHQFDGVRTNVWANRYTAGSGWGTAALIETDNTGDATSAQIAVDTSGNALAVWYQYDGTRNNIWANRYTAGTGWGAAALIESDNAGHAANPQVAIDANGNALAVWYQLDGTRNNIWANRFE